MWSKLDCSQGKATCSQGKARLSTTLVQSLGGPESIAMVERYTESLNFDDALQLCRQVNGGLGAGGKPYPEPSMPPELPLRCLWHDCSNC